MNAYFLTHLGLGDIFYCIGAVRYLTQFYENVYYLCKDKYCPNVRLIFANTPNIICVPVRTDIPENVACYDILHDKYEHNDVFICGFAHKNHHASKITNQKFLKSELIENKYNLDCDMINNEVYKFIIDFYADAHLNLSIMFDYWKIDYSEKSKDLYDMVKEYRIIFLQTCSSNMKRLNIKKLLEKNLHDTNTIMISNDENLYENEDQTITHIKKKHEICKSFVCNNFIYYIDTLMNSNEIYIIDSCFVGLVLPLYKRNKLIASPLRIIIRRAADTIEL